MTICTNCVSGIDKNRQICPVCNGTPEMPDAPVETTEEVSPAKDETVADVPVEPEPVVTDTPSEPVPEEVPAAEVAPTTGEESNIQ